MNNWATNGEDDAHHTYGSLEQTVSNSLDFGNNDTINNSDDDDDDVDSDDSDSSGLDSDTAPPVPRTAAASVVSSISDDGGGFSVTGHSSTAAAVDASAVEGTEYSVLTTRIPEDYGWSLAASTATTEENNNGTADNDSCTEGDHLCSEQYENYTCVESTCSRDKVLPETCEELLFDILGFVNNPLRQEPGSRNSAAADLSLSMMSNFSTAYNVISISLSLHILRHIYPMVGAEDSLCSSSLIAGMIVGQLAGGALGDVLGRHRAMTLVMFLQVSGALFSATAAAYETAPLHFSIYQVLAFWRFCLGIGAGGVYPLSATMTAESSHSPQDSGKAVALAFSCQGVGYLVVPVFSFIVVSTFGDNSDLSWRLILGFGALPGIVLTIMRVRSLYSYKKQVKARKRAAADSSKNQESTRRQEDEYPIDVLPSTTPHARAVPVSIVDAIKMEENLVRKMLGTGGCWLLFDILFYGNTLFQPVVLSAAFGSTETVQKAAMDTAMISAMALPGYLVSVFAVGRQSPKYIQAQGFLVMCLLYLCIGLFFDQLAREKDLLLPVYGSTFFFSNYGPNATTFMLPSITFSKPCRSTLNGICAACGKAGALLGTILFVAATDHFGQHVVFLACSGLALIGALLTVVCVSSHVGISAKEEGYSLIGANMDPEELLRREAESNKVPMRIVYSDPSLMNHFNTSEW
jgi:MFS transporter, PHS family, inorganic phosphate transporter